MVDFSGTCFTNDIGVWPGRRKSVFTRRLPGAITQDVLFFSAFLIAPASSALLRGAQLLSFHLLVECRLCEASETVFLSSQGARQGEPFERK